jgi:PEP-CTERM motif-containing protein
MGPIKRTMLMLVVAGLSALPAFADAFTSSSLFSTAISGMSGVQTANFDSDPTGNIAQGGTVDGINFNYNINSGAGSLAIVNMFDTTSPKNYLGSNDPTTGALFGGDSITMSFASPINALGLFIIGGPYGNADFTLASATANAMSSNALETTLGDGGEVIFLGITSTTAFSSAVLSLNANAGETWNVDDITAAGAGTSPVPEPSTFELLTVGLAIMCAWRVWKMRTAQAKLCSWPCW